MRRWLRSRYRRATWEVRWNEDRTVGEIWRLVDWFGYPLAPSQEGTIRSGPRR